MSLPNYKIRTYTTEIQVMDINDVKSVVTEWLNEASEKSYLQGKYSTLPDWMSRKKAADTLGCCVRSISTMVLKGRIRANNEGRVMKEDVLAMLYKSIEKNKSKTISISK